MKKIHIKYNIMIDDDKFDKACARARVGRDIMVNDLKQRAQVFGRTAVYEFIEEFVMQKQGALRIILKDKVGHGSIFNGLCHHQGGTAMVAHHF